MSRLLWLWRELARDLGEIDGVRVKDMLLDAIVGYSAMMLVVAEAVILIAGWGGGQ